jgi:hypothetical protein
MEVPGFERRCGNCGFLDKGGRLRPDVGGVKADIKLVLCPRNSLMLLGTRLVSMVLERYAQEFREKLGIRTLEPPFKIGGVT